MIHIKHFGDITKIDGHKVPIVDVITGGSPCQDLSVAGLRKGIQHSDLGDEETTRSGLFMDQIRIVKEQREESIRQLNTEFGENFDRTKIKPRYMVWENVCHSGTTYITTYSGYKYIKDVEVGDLVRTHDGTYHKVLKTYKTEMQPTITVKYQGGEITCTPNHPFLSENLTYRPIGEFTVGDRVGFKVDESGTKSIGMATAYAFGRWLADGSVAIRNDRKTKHRIFISTGYKKYDELKSELSKLPYKVNEHKMDWAINFTFSSDEFGELTDSAGYGARYKQVPEWVFELVAEERNEVLRGYLAGDGYFREDRGTWSFGTSSEKLALGLCRLIRAVYHVGVSLSYKEGKGTTIIEGREVNAHDHWVGEFSLPTIDTSKCKNIPNRAKYENGYVWVRIREILEGEVQDVYNLSIEDNNTYEANGVVCHNCGAFSSGEPGGADFQAVLEEIVKIVRKDCPHIPIPKDGWTPSGNLDGVGDDGIPFSVCWRVHDAQFWGRTVRDSDTGNVLKMGTPQRRRRIALVADFRGTSAPEILFECESVSGNTESSCEKGQGTSGDIADRIGETSQNPIGESDRRITDLDTSEQSPKVYGISGYDSNAMKSSNPHSGIYEADSARTLDLNGGNLACNQGGMAVVQNTTNPVSSGMSYCIGNGQENEASNPELEVAKTLNCLDDPMKILTVQPSEPYCVETPTSTICIEGNGSRESHKGSGYSESETMFTLNTVEQHAVCYGIDQQCGKGGANYTVDVAPTMASDSHGTPNAVAYGVTTPEPVVQSSFTPGSFMNIDNDGNTAFNLRARDYKDPQCVVAFEPGAASRVGGHIYSDDKSGTLRADAGDNQQAVCIGVDTNKSYSMCIGNGQVDNAASPEYELSKTLNCMVDPMKVLCVENSDSPCQENIPANLAKTYRKSAHAKTSEDGQGWEETEVNDTLNGFDNGESRTPTLVLNDQGGQHMEVSEDKTATLRAEEHGHQPLVFDASRRHDYKPFGDVCETVQAQYGTGGNNTPMVMDMLNLDPKQTEKCMTLNAYNGTGGNNTPMVFENHSQDTRFTELGDVCQTVSANWGMGGNNQPLEVSPQTAIVRRLTPKECERLQGFPDNWTDIGDWVDSQGKKHISSDALRYKALGNSICLPFWDWMAGRMVAQLKKSGVEHSTMASLFDGISGFPLVYLHHGCMPIWTSEIEEYPIAVCRKHFGDEDTGETGDVDNYLKIYSNPDNSVNQKDVTNSPISFDRAAFNQGQNAKYDFAIDEDKAQTLVARGPGGGYVCE